MISIHDSFQGPNLWADFLKGADRLALDQHLYLAFRDPNTLSLKESALMVRLNNQLLFRLLISVKTSSLAPSGRPKPT